MENENKTDENDVKDNKEDNRENIIENKGIEKKNVGNGVESKTDKRGRIEVIRLGHRLPRDERMTTHIGLVSRAFGASKMYYSGMHDSSLENTIKRIVDNWGGNFEIEYIKKNISLIKQKKRENAFIIHLTMYGLPLPEGIDKINKQIQDEKDIVIIVGAEKVPIDVYNLADINISITNQPHSEVAALAITLDRIMKGNELKREFGDRFKGKLKIIPSEKEKRIEKVKQSK